MTAFILEDCSLVFRAPIDFEILNDADDFADDAKYVSFKDLDEVTFTCDAQLHPVFALYIRHQFEIQRRLKRLFEPRLIIWPEDAMYWKNYKWEIGEENRVHIK